eukprot:3632093-Rhodomonas_salina.1
MVLGVAPSLGYYGLVVWCSAWLHSSCGMDMGCMLGAGLVVGREFGRKGATDCVLTGSMVLQMRLVLPEGMVLQPLLVLTRSMVLQEGYILDCKWQLWRFLVTCLAVLLPGGSARALRRGTTAMVDQGTNSYRPTHVLCRVQHSYQVRCYRNGGYWTGRTSWYTAPFAYAPTMRWPILT